MNHMLDLFSGLGGASEAFLRSGWNVLRIENNPLLAEVPNTVLMDVKDLTPHTSDGKLDFLWASPPCREFSLGYHAPGPKAKREGKSFQPDLTLVKKAMCLIETLKPRYWCIENVRGSIKHLQPLLGEPTLIIGPWVFWGNFPKFDPKLVLKKLKKEDAWSTDPLRANIRAKVPFEISASFLKAITQQHSLLSYIEPHLD